MMMKTPAIRNQYGEMYTGMPNGRATTIPGPVSRRWGGFSAVAGGFSGVVLATIPMLRGVRAVRVGASPPRPPAGPHHDREQFGCYLPQTAHDHETPVPRRGMPPN